MTSSEAGCRGQGGLRLLSRESPIIFRTPSLPRSAQEPPPRSPLSVHKSIEHKIVLYIPPVKYKKIYRGNLRRPGFRDAGRRLRKSRL